MMNPLRKNKTLMKTKPRQPKASLPFQKKILASTLFLMAGFTANMIHAETIASGTTVNAIDKGTPWNVSPNLDVNGQLNIGSSAIVNVNSTGVPETGILNIGYGSGSTGVVNVSGSGQLNAGYKIFVGRGSGQGSLIISNGGTVIAENGGNVGSETADANGTITVTGLGSSFNTNSGDLYIGGKGVGVLNIEDQATVNIRNTNGTAILYVGQSAGSDGTITVKNAGSSLNSALLIVGEYGTGRLIIEDGASSTVNGYIKVGNSGANSNGSILVTGSGSALTANGTFRVGGINDLNMQGKGSLTIANQGMVNVTAGTLIVGQKGAINIGAASGEAAQISGTLNTNNITLDGALNLNHTDNNYALNANISGLGSINQLSTGSSILAGNNAAFIGSITINDGILSVANSSNLGATTGAGTLTINGGTLHTIGNVISDRAVILGSQNGTLDIDAGQTFSLSGNISGTGSLTHQGSGKTILTGTNNYTGGTSVLSGSLEGNTNSLQGNILNNASLIFNQAIDGTYTGALTGSGNLSKTGSGVLTLNADNYIGTLNHNAGTLNINIGKTLNVTGNATLANNVTLGVGVDANTPALIADSFSFGSNNTLEITGYNLTNTSDDQTYNLIETTNGVSGDFIMTVNGNTLGSYVDEDTYLIGSAKKDSTGKNVVANVGLVWNHTQDDSAHGTFNITGSNEFTIGPAAVLSDNTLTSAHKSIWDGKTLTKKGTGTLILNSVNTYTGDTNINEGKLIVGSNSGLSTARIAGDVNVYTGATLGGHGTIAGHVLIDNGGTISPGNSVGNITVGGITFNTGSIYEFEVNSNGSADKITSTNAATINGGQVNVLANGNIWQTTSQYTILTSTGRTGVFDGVNTNLAFLDPLLTYDANNAYLTLVRNDVTFEEVGQTPNQKETAEGLDSLGSGDTLYDTIASMDESGARKAYDNLSGEIYASTNSAIFLNSRYVRDALNDHMQSFPTIRKTDEAQNQSAWMSVWGHEATIDADGNAAEIKNKSSGFLIGSDIALTENSKIGLAAGYEYSDIKANDRQSKSTVDALHFAFMAVLKSVV